MRGPGGALNAPPDARAAGLPVVGSPLIGRMVGWTFALVLLLGSVGFVLTGDHAPDWVHAIIWASAARSRGLAAYDAGRFDEARAAFRQAAGAQSRDPVPHIYLARMARETGDLTTARTEATRALEVAPTDAGAQREMGAYLLAIGRPELARRFFVRALAIAPHDHASQGWLACTLARLGQPVIAQHWLHRAGPGTWSACVTDASSPSP